MTHAKNLRHKEAATDGSNGKGLNPTPLHLEYESGEPGQFTTKTFSAPCGKCFANLDARQGWVEFVLLSGSGQTLPGMLPCRLEGVEGTDIPLPLQIPPQIVAGMKLFRLQIRMAHARIFALSGA